MVLSSNFGKKFLSLSEKKQEKFVLSLSFVQFAFINDHPNATFTAFALKYVFVYFFCIKSCTTLVLCNKASFIGKDFILAYIIEIA